MTAFTRNTGRKARVSLPASFANATVLIEQISDTELRIPEDEIRFAEETRTPLCDRDRDYFLALLDNPPAANAALEKRPGSPSPMAEWSIESTGQPSSPTMRHG